MTAEASARGRRSQGKGKAWERRVAAYLTAQGLGDARRTVRAGTRRHADEGDLTGLPFTVQCKDHTGAMPTGPTPLVRAAWVGEARAQARAVGHQVALVVDKAKGRADPVDARAHLDCDTLVQLLHGRPAFAVLDWRVLADSGGLVVTARLGDLVPLLRGRFGGDPPSG